MRLEDLNFFVPLVEKTIKKHVPPGFPNLYDGMSYVYDTGGKRLRPNLCLAVCEIFGGNLKKSLPFATAIEIVHNATLVHDDIEDGDETRRGFQSVWKKYGIADGINIGDGMIFKSYECLLESKKFLSPEKVLELTESFTDTIMKIIEGQSMEFDFRKRGMITVEEYKKMASRKAGFLFGLALSGGAFIADAPEKAQTSLMEFGKSIGLAFQIRDDVLNLIGKQEKYGKEIGGDIKEGKRTLIFVHCLLNCNDDEKKKLLEIFNKQREIVNQEDVKFAINLFKKYGSVKFAQEYSKDVVEQAKKHLGRIENQELKEFLEEFANFMISREY